MVCGFWSGCFGDGNSRIYAYSIGGNIEKRGEITVAVVNYLWGVGFGGGDLTKLQIRKKAI